MKETATTAERRPWWRTREGPLLNKGSVAAFVGVLLTWALSLSGVHKHVFAGLPEQVQAWSRACPTCGTVEAVAILQATRASGDPPVQVHRLTIRMADGSLRHIDRSAPFPPGAQVLVEGGSVRPVPPAVAQRQ